MKSYQAGDLRETIVIKRKDGTTRNQSNELVQTWVTYKTVRAKREDLTADDNERFEGNQLRSSQFTNFIVRYFPMDGLSKMRIEEARTGRIYDIETIIELQHRQFMSLKCKETEQR